MAGCKLRGYNTNTERELDVSGLRIIEPFNDYYTATVDFWTYRLLNKSSWYDDYVAHELQKMSKKIAVEMKNRICSGKDMVLVIAFLQELKEAWEACEIHEGTATWLSKKDPTGLAKAVVKARLP